MADAGEGLLAEEFRTQLGLPPDVLRVDPGLLAAQEAARQAHYLQLELPDSAVLFAGDAAGLAAAADALAGSQVLGLDVEWKPSHTAGAVSPAAILQVCARHAVVWCSQGG